MFSRHPQEWSCSAVCVPNDTENVTLFLQTLLHLLHTVCYMCNIGCVTNVTSGVLQVSHKARRRCVAPHLCPVLHGACTQRRRNSAQSAMDAALGCFCGVPCLWSSSSQGSCGRPLSGPLLFGWPDRATPRAHRPSRRKGLVAHLP